MYSLLRYYQPSVVVRFTPHWCLRICRKLLLPNALLLLVTGFGTSLLAAQIPNRITQAVDSTRLRGLPQHLPLWAKAANSIGVVPAGQAVGHLTLVLARSSQQQEALDQFEAELQDPSSPNYHHWLTAAEFGERFGQSQQDLDALTTWLKSQGLKVNWVSPSGTFINFGGSAADVGQAFHTTLRNYQVHGQVRMSVSSEPMIPAALAPAVKAIHGLYDVEDSPAHRMSVESSDGPQATTGDGSHYITPGDFGVIYDYSINYGGQGQTIGIVGRSRTDFADFDNFIRLTGAQIGHPTEVIPTAFGGLDPGPALTAPPAKGVSIDDQGEATLDVMRAASVAPNAKVLLVAATQASGGIEADAQYLVQTTPVPAQVMSISFGTCESSAGLSGVTFWDTLFEQAATEGISSFASSGDTGASGCDTNFAAPPATPLANSINYICSSSYVTCVGGTEFADTSNPSLYWNANNSYGLASAISYIPEGGWNEPLDAQSSPQAAASGGGVSSFIATPAWQTGTGVPAARTGRYTPDLSFSAAGHDGYLGCLAAAGASCVADADGGYIFTVFSGTSATAPAMAGVAALLDFDNGIAHGNLNPGIYKMAAEAPTAFHDATVASSDVANCSLNTPSICNNSAPSATGLTGGQAGYLLTTGYDLVTGLGSLDISNFLRSFDAELITPTIKVTPSATTLTNTQDLTVAIAVAGGTSNATPTGSVVLSFGIPSGTYSSTATVLTNGSASIVIPAKTLPVNIDTLTVNYTPDGTSASTYGVAKATSTVTVNFASPVTPMASFFQSSYTINSTQNLDTTFTVSGGQGNWVPTGSVVFSCGSYIASPAPLYYGSQGTLISSGVLPVGNCTLTGVYTPDSASATNYTSATGTAAVTVTIPPLVNPTISVTPASTSISATWPLSVKVFVSSGSSGYPEPTGSLVFSSGTYHSSSIALAGGWITFTVPGGSLAAGTNTLTVTYTPDAASAVYYNAASNTATITAVASSTLQPTVNIAVYTEVVVNAAFNAYVGVDGGAGNPIPTGTVTLSGASYTSAPTALGASGEVSISVPGGSLPAGNDTLSATYTPDTAGAVYYTAAAGSKTITVDSAPIPSFSLSGGNFAFTAGSTTQNSAGIDVTPAGGFVGNVTLSATIASSPAGAVNLPTFSFGSTSPVAITRAGSVDAVLTITTTAASSASLQRPAGSGIPWTATGGATLACLLLLGIPAARRRWGSWPGMVLLLIAVAGGLGACGGGGAGSSSPTTPSSPSSSGTTKGLYVITITGTSSGTSGTLSATSTINLTIQ